MKRAALWLALAPVVAGPAVASFADTAPVSAPSASAPGTSAAGTPSDPTGITTSTSGTSGSANPSASTTTTTAPPPGAAEATAAGIVGVVAVGHSKANAGPDGASSSANAIEVGGEPLIPDVTGGSSKGNGSAKGALFDTGVTPLGRLMLAPFDSTSSSGSDSSRASADAALARLTLIDPSTGQIDVLESHSDASYDATGSKGSATTNGAHVNLGDGQLDVVVLHSDSTSQAKGTSYLASVNGQTIGSDKDANGQCVLDASPLVKLTCLSASGGAGQPVSASSVGTGTLFPGQGIPEGVVAQTQGSGVATPGAGTGVSNSGNDNGGTRVLGEKVPNTGGALGSLPFTGLNVAGLSAYAMALVGMGIALLRIRRRERTDS